MAERSDTLNKMNAMVTPRTTRTTDWVSGAVMIQDDSSMTQCMTNIWGLSGLKAHLASDGVEHPTWKPMSTLT